MGLVILLHPPMHGDELVAAPIYFSSTLVRLLVIEMFASNFFPADASQFELKKGNCSDLASANHRLVPPLASAHQRSLHGQQSVIRRLIDGTD